MDDGTEGIFGGERRFRAEFEACASEEGQETSWKGYGLALGWEGGISSSAGEPMSVADMICQDGDDKSSTICLCFEGGAGAIQTTWEAVRKRTPALVFGGSGRASDFIADYLDLTEDRDAVNDGLVIRPQTCIASKTQVRRKQLLEALKERLYAVDDPATQADGELTALCEDLCNEYQIVLPTDRSHFNPLQAVRQLKDITASGLCLVFRLGGMRRAQGRLVPVRLDEYMSRCLLCGIKKVYKDKGLVSRTLNRQLSCFGENKVLDNLFLHGFGSDLAHPSYTSGDMDGSTAICATEDGDGRAGRLSYSNQSDLDRNTSTVTFQAAGQRTEDRRPASTSKVVMSRENSLFTESGISDDRLRADFSRDALRILTVWGQTSLVQQMLEEQAAESGNLVSTDLLNSLLHEALVHDKLSIASLAMDFGANTEWYSPDLRGSAHPDGSRTPWKSLLVGATDDAREYYLLRLIQKAHEGLSSRGDFNGSFHSKGLESAHDIKDDTHALLLLNEVFSMVVCAEHSGQTGVPNVPFFFTHDRNRAWNDAEHNLFLFLLLVNRSDVAGLFFTKAAKKVPTRTSRSAMWACLICTRLSVLPEVGKFSYNLRIGFETTAAYYADIAGKILTSAYGNSERLTIMCLNEPLLIQPAWTMLDLVAKCECKALVAQCPELFIKAFQRRFFGCGSLMDAFRRMNARWESSSNNISIKNEESTFDGSSTPDSKYGHSEGESSKNVGLVGFFKIFQTLHFGSVKNLLSLKAKKVVKFTSSPSIDSGSFASLRDKFDFNLNEGKNMPEDEINWKLVALCALVDMVGMTRFLYPIVPRFCYVFLWPPVYAMIVHTLHQNLTLSLLSFIEEAIPVLGFLPAATIGWVLRERESRRPAQTDIYEAHRQFCSIDNYLLDGCSHLYLSYAMTMSIVLDDRMATTNLEIFVIFMMTLDQIPDILFAGLGYDHDALDGANDENVDVNAEDHSMLYRSLSHDYSSTFRQNNSPPSLSSVFWSGLRSYVSNAG